MIKENDMKFLSDNIRFSFLYGGVSAFDYLYTSKTAEAENSIVTEYLFEDALKVTNCAKKIFGFDFNE